MAHSRFITTRLVVIANMVAVLLLATACGGGEPPTDPVPKGPSTPAPTASLSGTVLDDHNGAPVAGATVVVRGVTVTTGTAGQFLISNLATGQSGLTLSAPGFDPFSGNVSLSAGANTVELTLMRVNTLFAAGEFSVYIPPELSIVRGVFLVLYGGFFDSRPMIRRDFDAYANAPPGVSGGVAAYRQSLMAFAREHGFAVMGTTTPASPIGLHTAIRQALTDVGSQSGHAELAHASLVVQGHSRGGCMAYQIAVQDPQRVIGVISMAPSGVDPCLVSAQASVPGYFILGELDFASLNDPVITQFAQNRGGGALWALAIERTVGHTWTTNHNLVFAWAAAVAVQRVPETITPGTPVALQQLNATSGWLGDRTTGAIAGYPCFSGNPATASWLPNEQTARDWQTVAVGAGTVTVCGQ